MGREKKIRFRKRITTKKGRKNGRRGRGRGGEKGGKGEGGWERGVVVVVGGGGGSGGSGDFFLSLKEEHVELLGEGEEGENIPLKLE